MTAPSFHFKSHLDYPRASETLACFQKRIADAVSAGDESLLQHLYQCFKVGNDPLAIYIGCICGHGRDASSTAQLERIQKRTED